MKLHSIRHHEPGLLSSTGAGNRGKRQWITETCYQLGKGNALEGGANGCLAYYRMYNFVRLLVETAFSIKS